MNFDAHQERSQGYNYGVPKIHKGGNPPRPIVSFLTSPTYNLSKHLAKVLGPLVGNTLSAVRNSY